MNLCLVCRDVRSNGHGGLARSTADLAVSLAREGHEVRLLTDTPPTAAPDLRDVSIETLRLPASGPLTGAAPETAAHNLMYAAEVYREVKRIHEEERTVDVVLAPLWRSEGAVCLLDDRFPTIVSCMTSLTTLTQVDEASFRLPDITQRLSLEREALLCSRYLHGLTEAVLSKTIRDYGLQPEATAVVGRGLRDHGDVELREVKRDGVAHVLFVGRIEHRKGVDTLLAAARELVADGAAVRFTLAGANVDPSFRQAFECAAGCPELADRVRFAGAVSDSELYRLYRECDIVCVPSRYESHGVVLVEAMMFGKPIVTCSAGGIGEVIDAGRTALVSPPEDSAALAASLRRLAEDAGLRGKLGRAARQAYEERFEAGAVALRLVSFMEEVVALHQGIASASNDVNARLQGLLRDVLKIAPEAACAVAGELLDPGDAVAERALQRLHAVALTTPPPQRSSVAQISALVLTRNRPRSLGRTLDSLALTRMPLRTVVIDNGSGTAAAERVASDCAHRPHTQLRRSDRNLGCAGGRRLGLELIETEMVLLLDDDAELLPDALEHLAAALDADPSAGAVTATVVLPDGRVQHSGGSLEVGDETASFGLIGADRRFAPDGLPQSGPAGWVPGTAVLVRSELLREFPIDEQMAAYFGDNEWCYRVSLARPGLFRRSREALVLHHLTPRSHDGVSFGARAGAVEWLAACARFYERHGLVLTPALFDLVPDLRAEDGTCDLAAGRLLMELMIAKGSTWTLTAWMDGDLTGLLSAHRRTAELHLAESDLHRAEAALERAREEMVFLHARHKTLCRIEQGGWWRLRQRVLPAIRLAGRLRALRRGQLSPLQSGKDA